MEDNNNNNNNEVGSNEDYFNLLPIGYRFVPTDEELISYYLYKKINNIPLGPNRIHEVELYNYHPKDLTGEYKLIRESEWYFFTTRNKRYKNGRRPNRSAGIGSWKATGSQKFIKIEGENLVGKRMSLEYSEINNSTRVKTDWKMHEYVIDKTKSPRDNDDHKIQLDDWVLCKIYKNKIGSNNGEDGASKSNVVEAVQQLNSTNYYLPHAYSFGDRFTAQLIQQINFGSSDFFPYSPLLPLNNTFNNSIQLQNPSYGLEPSVGLENQAFYGDVVDMTTINNHVVPQGTNTGMVNTSVLNVQLSPVHKVEVQNDDSNREDELQNSGDLYDIFRYHS